MKKLITFKDGTYMPLWQEDFAFVQENITEVITEFCKAFAYGRARYIISGCAIQIESQQYLLEQGLVMFDGEILFVPEQTQDSGISSPAFHITKESFYSTSGRKLFVKPDESTELRDTYDSNFGKLNIIPSELVDEVMLIADNGNVADTLLEKIAAIDTGWVDLDLQGNYATSHVDKDCQYRVYGKVVSLRGKLTLADSVIYDGNFASIPNQYTPDSSVAFVGSDYAITTEANGQLIDNLNGNELNLNSFMYII